MQKKVWSSIAGIILLVVCITSFSSSELTAMNHVVCNLVNEEAQYLHDGLYIANHQNSKILLRNINWHGSTVELQIQYDNDGLECEGGYELDTIYITGMGSDEVRHIVQNDYLYRITKGTIIPLEFNHPVVKIFYERTTVGGQ